MQIPRSGSWGCDSHVFAPGRAVGGCFMIPLRSTAWDLGRHPHPNSHPQWHIPIRQTISGLEEFGCFTKWWTHLFTKSTSDAFSTMMQEVYWDTKAFKVLLLGPFLLAPYLHQEAATKDSPLRGQKLTSHIQSFAPSGTRSFSQTRKWSAGVTRRPRRPGRCMVIVGGPGRWMGEEDLEDTWGRGRTRKTPFTHWLSLGLSLYV